jgi:serine/threonine-protein kinase RsbW
MKFTDEPLTPFGEVILDMSIPTNLSFKSPLVYRMINELIARSYVFVIRSDNPILDGGFLPAASSPKIELVLDEALANAMVHGNKLDPEKTIRIQLFIDDARWGVVITDQGDGFDPGNLKKSQDSPIMFEHAGLGINLMERYVDELHYGLGGRSIMLVRHRQTQPEAADFQETPFESKQETIARDGSPISINHEERISIIVLNQPRITRDNSDHIRDVISQEAQEFECILIDMRNVEFISSAFIGAIMAIYRILHSKNGKLIISDLNDPVNDVLQSVSLDRIVEIASNKDEGLASLRNYLIKRS